MKYIISLGFCFIKYKRPMQVKVSSTQMIDDFLLSEDIPEHDNPVVWPENTFDEEFYRRFLKSREAGEIPYRSIPNKFFFYEVNEHMLGENLIIDVNCQDNNYTNGFMTETSLHKLRMTSILPKKFLTLYCGSKGKHRAIQRLYQRSYKSIPPFDDTIPTWPYYRKNWKIESKTQELDKKLTQDDATGVWLGGKIKYTIPIIKKFGIKMLDPYHKKRHGYIASNFFCYKEVFEKYYRLNMANED